MNRIFLAMTAVLLLLGAGSRAQTKPAMQAKAKKPSASGKVLDFKDQLIEGSILDSKSEASGQRKSSPLFMELGKGDTSMDSIVFKRSDFNDFHTLQMKQRVFIQKKAGK